MSEKNYKMEKYKVLIINLEKLRHNKKITIREMKSVKAKKMGRGENY
jgi:hypothetical protein